MKRIVVATLSALVVTIVVAGAPVGAAPRTCAVTWGSGEKAAGPSTSPSSEVLDVRTGRHGCYDRFVVDLGGPASGYSVQYVNRYRAEGSNEVIPLPGGARLRIIVKAPAVDTGGHATYAATVGDPLPDVTVAGYDTFRSHRYGGTFEGFTSFGLGVRARLPFRVTKVGTRVVIDVAHHW